MAHSHDDIAAHECSSSISSSVHQTLDEMEFERGLWKAAMDGDVERLEMLLHEGHDPNRLDSAGYTALHYATRHGHTRVAELLLLYGAVVDPFTPSVKSTPLHRAAAQGHAETVQILLHHGANANLRDTDGKTALHRALSKPASSTETFIDSSYSDTCKLLIPHTDLNIKDNAGITPKDLLIKTYDMVFRVLELKNWTEYRTKLKTKFEENLRTVESEKTEEEYRQMFSQLVNDLGEVWEDLQRERERERERKIKLKKPEN